MSSKSSPSANSVDDPAWLDSLKRSTRPARRRAFILSLFINSFAMMTSVFVLQVYDKVVYFRGIDTLVALVIGMAFVLAFDFVLRRIRSDLMRSVSTYGDVYTASSLFRHIMSLPLMVLESRSSEAWNSLFRDLSLVRNRLGGPAAIAIMDFPFAFMMLGLIFLIARPVFLVPIFFTVLILIVLWRSEKVLQKRVAEEQKALGKRRGNLFDVIDARLTIKGHQMQDAAFESWSKDHADTIDSSIERGGSNDFYETLSHTIAQSASVSLIAIGALAIVDGQMTIGGLIAANILSGRAINTMSRLISQWRTYRESKEAETRLTAVFNIEPDKTVGALSHEKPKGVVKFENINFSYSSNAKPAINAVSGSIMVGGITAVIGANGSGKSSLLKLIRGLYRPSSGRILLDGYDMTQFSQKDLANWIGYMPQETSLINGSFYDNIVFGMDPAPSDDRVFEAAKMAACHENIIDFPSGYETVLVNNGSNITPGLKAKIALARLFVRDSSALLFDEPTNHLDNISFTKMIETFHKLKSEKNIVVVTHHMGLLRASDNIIMLEKGKVIRFGPSARILKALAINKNDSQPEVIKRQPIAPAGASPDVKPLSKAFSRTSAKSPTTSKKTAKSPAKKTKTSTLAGANTSSKRGAAVKGAIKSAARTGKKGDVK